MYRHFVVTALCLNALAALGCGKEHVTNPKIEPTVPWIAIDTTGFNIAESDTIRGTAGNYPDSAVLVGSSRNWLNHGLVQAAFGR